MKKPTKQEIKDQFGHNTEYRSEYFITPAYDILELCLENDFIPDELLYEEDSIYFCFNSDDISSMDNLPKRTASIQITNEETSITIEECGNYFTDKFDIDKIEEYKEFLNEK